MPRDFKQDHDLLTDRYYRQGNPDNLSPGEFRLRHDAIWIEMDLAEGRKTQEEADRAFEQVLKETDGTV